MIEYFRTCPSYDHVKNTERIVNYIELVGDPCYRYNRKAKENFFKNPALAYLFFKAYYILTEDYRSKAPIHLTILQELKELAI